MFIKSGARSLPERLGFAPDARLVIVNCDDLGSSVEANSAIYEALRTGAAGSATLMVPCPAVDDACARYDGDDVGVHLTVTSEWDTVRWGPLTSAPSLRLDDGTFPRTTREVRTRADTKDVAIECRAQVRRALDAGIDVSHLDSHMHVLMNDQRLARVLVDLAAEFELPVRLPLRLPARRRRGLNVRRRVCEARRRAARRGVVVPDRFVDAPVGSRAGITRALGVLQPGVTEMLAHPVVDSPALRENFPDWEGRVDDYAFMVSGELGRLIDAAGARLHRLPRAPRAATHRCLTVRAFAVFSEAQRSVLRRRARDMTTRTSHRSALVFAPHADDETLGCGNTIIRKVAAGAKVEVVVAFDGVRAWHRSWNHDLLGLDDYVELRRSECREACRRLGLAPEHVHFLGFGGASDTSVPELAEQLRTFVTSGDVAEVFGPCGIDDQEDHRAVAEAVHRLRADALAAVDVFEYPVWFSKRWAWTRPERSSARQTADLVWGPMSAAVRLRPRLVRSPDGSAQKRRALAAHDSQVATSPEHPDRWTLDHEWAETFLGPDEMFFAVQELSRP